MAELAITLAFVLGGAVGFLIGRASAPLRKGGAAPAGKPPSNNPLQ